MGWKQTKLSVARLWHREANEVVEQRSEELRHSQEQLASTISALDTKAKREELEQEWQAKIAALLERNPELADDLATTVGLVRPKQADPNIQLGTAIHTGSGDLNQAGRDIIVHRTASPPPPE